MRKYKDQSRFHPGRWARSVVWRTRLLTAERRAVPDFVVLGAQRAGTTSFYEAIGTHPSIHLAHRKEVHYYDLHYGRGINWYRANFPLVSKLKPGDLTGEATPHYLVHPTVPSRMAGTIPDAKLIVLVRDPIERAHSAWRLRRRQGLDERSFEEAIDDEHDGPITAMVDWEGDLDAVTRILPYLYLAKGRYAEQLERWLGYYPREALCVIRSEDLFLEPQKQLEDLAEFLGIARFAAATVQKVNATAPADMSADTRKRLAEYYRPHNERLEALLGRSFGWN